MILLCWIGFRAGGIAADGWFSIAFPIKLVPLEGKQAIGRAADRPWVLCWRRELHPPYPICQHVRLSLRLSLCFEYSRIKPGLVAIYHHYDAPILPRLPGVFSATIVILCGELRYAHISRERPGNWWEVPIPSSCTSVLLFPP